MKRRERTEVVVEVGGEGLKPRQFIFYSIRLLLLLLLLRRRRAAGVRTASTRPPPRAPVLPTHVASTPQHPPPPPTALIIGAPHYDVAPVPSGKVPFPLLRINTRIVAYSHTRARVGVR